MIKIYTKGGVWKTFVYAMRHHNLSPLTLFGFLKGCFTMTKTINKKVLSFLMILVLSLCCVSMSASAAEPDAGVSPQWGGDITYLKINYFTVEAFNGYNSAGRPIGIPVNYSMGYVTGPTSWAYCALPDEFYQGMIDLNLKKFLCTCTFEVIGTELTTYSVEVDGKIISTKTLSGNGEYTVTWISNRKPDTEFAIFAETLSTRSTVTGRYRAEAYYNG